MKRTIQLSLLLAAFALVAFGQAATTATTLSVAVTATDGQWCVASATGIVLPSLSGNTSGSILYTDREFAQVIGQGTSSTCFRVRRAQMGSMQTAHAVNSRVYAGSAATGSGDSSRPFSGAFVARPPAGPCTASAQYTLPVIVTGLQSSDEIGDIYNCQATGADAGNWTLIHGKGTQMYRTMAAVTKSTAGAMTYTVQDLIDGLILRDPNGSARTDTLPTAANLIAGIPGAAVGTSLEFTVRNTADAAETITIASGSGGTDSGTMTIAQNNTKRFLIIITSLTTAAYTTYSLGTVVH